MAARVRSFAPSLERIFRTRHLAASQRRPLRESLLWHGTRGDRSRATRLCLLYFPCRRHPAAIETAHGVFFSSSNASFHYDCCTHPGVNAALKIMFAFRQARDLELAALKDARSCHRDFRKAASALLNYFPAWPVQRRYEATAELRNLGEGMRFAALVDGVNGSSFLDSQCVRFEVPVRVRSSGRRFRI